jgi:hypothetical protein
MPEKDVEVSKAKDSEASKPKAVKDSQESEEVIYF